MRNDFDRVLATGGHRKRYEDTRTQGLRSTNNHEPMRARLGWNEGGTAHYAPVYRYLRKQVGRLWDDIYSEACKTINRKTRTGKHFLTHLRDEVHLHSWRDTRGRIWVHRWGCASLLKDCRWGDFLYVDPEGVLRYLKPGKSRKWRGPQKDPDTRPVDKTHEFRKIDGLWYLIEFEWRTGEDLFMIPSHLILEEEGSLWRGRRVKKILQKKQLSKKELRTQGFRNERCR